MIEIFFMLIKGLISGFIYYIDVCDAVLTTCLVAMAMITYFQWSGWWALGGGAVVALLGYGIFRTKIGFWISTIFFSAMWTFLGVKLIVHDWWFPNMPAWLFWVLVAAGMYIGYRQHDASYWRAEVADEERDAEAAARKENQIEIVHMELDPETGKLRPATPPLPADSQNA